jgi:phage tail sheath gpL-like
MSASIVLAGLGANYLTPGNYLELLFAQGQAGGATSSRDILLIGNKTTAGSAVADTVIYGPDTPVPLQTEGDAIALFGAGSELHRGWRAVTAVTTVTTIRAIVVTESAGAAATATITFATTAAANGNVRFFYGGTYYDCTIASGDTVTAIAANFVSVINGITWLPFTAGNSAGVVTLTAKNKGPRGNWLRFGTLISGSGVATTVSTGVDQFFTGGTTADSSTTALGTLSAYHAYRLVSAAEDATQLGALCSQVGNLAQPINGNRQRVFAGSIDTLSNAITVATGINNARCDIVWQQYSQYTPFELACTIAGIVSLYEDAGDSPRCNFAGFGNDDDTSKYWNIKASRTTTAYPTKTAIESALHNGLSPIGVNSNGSTYLVNLITSRSLSGSTQDLRITAHHKVTVCDFLGDDWNAKCNLQFSGKKIANDPPKGAQPPGPDVVYPQLVRGAFFALLNDYDRNSLLENVGAIKDGTKIQREINPTTRISLQSPIDVIDILLQTASQLLQVG